jgi:uncharacterized protein (DUF1501 family)
MGLNRRRFLIRSAQLGGAIACSSLFRPQMVVAQGAAVRSGAAGRYFVHVVLDGGVCGLSFCPPAETQTFAALQTRRPSLMARQTGTNPNGAQIVTPYSISDIAITGHAGAPYGVHPGFKRTEFTAVPSLEQQLSQGNGRILAGVGKPAPDGSHDSAMKKLLTGADVWGGGSAKHWLAALIDRYEMPVDTVWALGSQPSIPLVAASSQPVTLERLSDYDYYRWGNYLGGNATADQASDLARGLVEDEDALSLTEPGRKLREAVLHAFDSRDAAVQRNAATVRSEWNGSPGVSGLFQDAVKIIRFAETNGNTAPMFIRITVPGFDTHGNQRSQMDYHASYFNRAIGLMMADLGATLSKTAILLESEFGRSIHENSLGSGVPADSRGTDHGWANNHLIFSGGLRAATPVVVGGAATASELSTATTLSRKVDWRLPIAETLEWMGINPTEAFPGIDLGAPLRLFV